MDIQEYSLWKDLSVANAGKAVWRMSLGVWTWPSLSFRKWRIGDQSRNDLGSYLVLEEERVTWVVLDVAIVGMIEEVSCETKLTALWMVSSLLWPDFDWKVGNLDAEVSSCFFK